MSPGDFSNNPEGCRYLLIYPLAFCLGVGSYTFTRMPSAKLKIPGIAPRDLGEFRGLGALFFGLYFYLFAFQLTAYKSGLAFYLRFKQNLSSPKVENIGKSGVAVCRIQFKSGKYMS